jgi:Bacterial transcriptional activator domain
LPARNCASCGCEPRKEAERFERANLPKPALEYAKIWARLEPLSEEASRLQMRLYYLQGDRGAALGVFEALKTALWQEMGVAPLPATLELAQMIERGAALPGSVPVPKAAVLPTAILRPPVLAGREREWALMEAAWQQGQLIFISGEAGSGKSRLAADFLQSKGSIIRQECRPRAVALHWRQSVVHHRNPQAPDSNRYARARHPLETFTTWQSCHTGHTALGAVDLARPQFGSSGGGGRHFV